MDAKPQRIRVRGDENVPPSFHATKSVHQRNKSTPALNVLAQGTKNGGRRAFGDVSNTKNAVRGSCDDSALVGKPEIQVSDGKPALAQPAQRPMSMSGLKGLLNNVTAKPMNPAGKAQPELKNSKRNNVIYRDQLQPVAEREPSKEVNSVRSTCHSGLSAQESVSNNVKIIVKKEKPSIAINVDSIATNVVEEPHAAESDATLSDTEESKAMAPPKHAVSITSEPEDYWEDEEYDSTLALGFPLRADNTTGGTITVIFPRMNERSKREIIKAKSIVDAAQTEDEILEDFYDSSMVAEYSSEIFLHLRTKELSMLPFADYMANQAEIQWSMRSVLMDWLVQVHFRFGLLPETLFLCVNYIDRFLSHKVVSLGKLQLVGATALLIAAKFEEITAPSIHEIVYMVDGGYSVADILKAERFMLTILNFDLGWPGPMSFLRRISKADDYDLETRTVAKYFLELTIMDERFVCTPPSFAAAGAHCLARMMLRKGCWTPAHAFYSGYIYQQLLPVMITMLECCENPQRHHQAIYDKYLDRRFKRASLYVEAEVQRGFTLPAASPLNNEDRLDGYVNY